MHGVAGGHHVGGGERLRRQIRHGEVSVVGLAFSRLSNKIKLHFAIVLRPPLKF